MKKLILVVLLFCPVIAFSQKERKSYLEPWDKMDWVNYGRDIASEYAKSSEEQSKKYLLDKMLAFKNHCKNDTIIFPVGDWEIKYYVYRHPEPTFEYFIEWLQKNK